MGVRAWSIIKYNDKPYIIVEFNHKNMTAGLALWGHRICAEDIRAIMPLPIEIFIPLNELELLCKILFKW